MSALLATTVTTGLHISHVVDCNVLGCRDEYVPEARWKPVDTMRVLGHFLNHSWSIDKCFQFCLASAWRAFWGNIGKPCHRRFWLSLKLQRLKTIVWPIVDFRVSVAFFEPPCPSYCKQCIRRGTKDKHHASHQSRSADTAHLLIGSWCPLFLCICIYQYVHLIYL